MIFRINNEFYSGAIVLNDDDSIQMVNGSIFPSEQGYIASVDYTNVRWSVWAQKTKVLLM